MSELYQENMERQNKNGRWKGGLAFLCIPSGSLIVTVDMNTFVGRGELVPGGLTGLAKLTQRIGLSFHDVQMSFTFLNALFNAIPAVSAYRLVGERFTILPCICLLAVSVLVDELPVVLITGDILLISVFGDISNGLGISLVLDNRVCGGGTDFIAMSLSAKYKVSTFSYTLLPNAVIVLTSGTTFGMGKALYSIIFRLCNTQVVSTLYKEYKKKVLLIVTGNPAAVSVDLLEPASHSNTTLKGFNSYSANKKYLIYTVLSDSDVRRMKKRIREQYPDTFVNVINFNGAARNFCVQSLE